MKIMDAAALETIRVQGMKKLFPAIPKISVGMGTCGAGNGAHEVYESFQNVIKAKKAKIQLSPTGCFGFCAEETLVNCYLPGMPLLILHKITPKDAEGIVNSLLKGIMPVKKALCKIEKWDCLTAKLEFGMGLPGVPVWNEIPFFKGQKKIVLREAGLIDPEDIEEYIALGGYGSLLKALTQMTPDAVLEEIKKAKLRGTTAARPSVGPWRRTGPARRAACSRADA